MEIKLSQGFRIDRGRFSYGGLQLLAPVEDEKENSDVPEPTNRDVEFGLYDSDQREECKIEKENEESEELSGNDTDWSVEGDYEVEDLNSLEKKLRDMSTVMKDF